MGTVLKGGTVIELEPASVERVDLRVEGGLIAARAPMIAPQEGDEVVDLNGKLVMPGLVCAHHHLYSALARGMPPVSPAPENFQQVLERIWWRLDRALTPDMVHVSATVGALDALLSGTTTIIDHHASPSAIDGSLTRVARGVNEVGLRGILCYEVTDRNGPEGTEQGLVENATFIRKAQGRFRGMAGAHAAFTLGHEALGMLRQLVETTGTALHIHLAEDPSDERLSFERFGDVPVTRLLDHGLLQPGTIVAHAVHLSWPELSQVIGSGAWLVHNPRSNMNNQVGYAPAGKFGSRSTVGTDGIGADMFAEVQLAHFRARESGQPIEPLHLLANGHRLVSKAFGMEVGPMREGAAADLLVLDYRSPTPVTAENLEAHLVYGFGARQVESVMVDGIWRLWARRPLSVNPDVVTEQSRQTARELWSRMAAL
ncbi:MAG TPA: amidohydrolase family protein [Myxococcales bacterium]|nr:amidohydrolase family protein [Myxococcales bacterium]